MTTYHRPAYPGGPTVALRHSGCGGPDCRACDVEQEVLEREHDRAMTQRCRTCGTPILGDPNLPDLRDYCTTNHKELAA